MIGCRMAKVLCLRDFDALRALSAYGGSPMAVGLIVSLQERMSFGRCGAVVDFGRGCFHFLSLCN